MVGHPNWMTNQPAWTGVIWPPEGSTYQGDYTGRQQKPYEQIRSRPGTATPPQTPTGQELEQTEAEIETGTEEKTRDEKMRGEVRSAVDEYMSSMIAERNLGGSTQATRICPHDLMVCGQKEGYRTSYDSANSMMEQFTKPGMRMIRKSMTPVNGQTRGLRSKSVPVPNTESTWVQERSWTPQPPSYKKKEYHWSVWKTTPSPAPPTPHPPSAPPPAAPPKQPIHDPWIPQTPDSVVRVPNPGVRFNSPVCESFSPVALQKPTPEPFKTPEPFVTPEIFRSPTVNGLTGEFDTRHKNRTPSEFDPDHRDNMAAAQVEPMTDNRNQMPGAPQFEPALKAWIVNATPQERHVAYNMFKAMNGGVSASPDPLSRNTRDSMSRAKSAKGAQVPKQQVTVNYAYKPCNVRMKAPPATQMYPHQEDQAVKDLARSLEGMDPSNYIYKTKKQRYPVARHSKSDPPRKDYTHENSFFMNARQPYRSHFIINPEWISENPSMKRNLKMMMSSKGPQGMRYSSK